MSELHSWGRYPRIDAKITLPLSRSQCVVAIDGTSSVIARGQGRSYGDSALAAHVLATGYLNHFHAFDATSGLLTCDAGVTLNDVVRTFVPLGWFLPVTPGTRFISVGGAIASDVHGKNHHVDGTFTEHVRCIDLLLGNGDQVKASAEENPDLFRATCGGMGLTGVILCATFQLKPIAASDIVETTIKAPCLEVVLEAFDAHCSSQYSVAWIDCLARGAGLGRSLLLLGEHAGDGPLTLQPTKALTLPIDLPTGLLCQASVRAFNMAYYGRVMRPQSVRRVPFEPFFYPLDTIIGWNRLYGKPGFVQYQCVLPKTAGLPAMRELLEHIAQSGLGSFLAVLKVFGTANANLLSFPTEGYTLALDFKVEPAVFGLLDKLDRIVLFYGGRLYLTKDARMSAATFKACYPRWQEFETVREKWHAHGKFASAQSRRLGLL
jgi:FAD/FMN-containing dehydrogenase